jgi:hypothetical protein
VDDEDDDDGPATKSYAQLDEESRCETADGEDAVETGNGEAEKELGNPTGAGEFFL